MIIKPEDKDLPNEQLTRKELLENALKTAGTDPNAFEILDDEPFVIQQMIARDKVMAFYVAVSKSNGMMFFFAAEPEESPVNDDWMRGPLPNAIGNVGDL